MLKKTIEYTDYNGVERKEDFYFHLSEAEVTDWLTTSGNYGLDKVVERLIVSENAKEVMNIFKDLIYRSYGEKSLDGRRFIKSKEVKDSFVETEAYSQLYMELISDPKKAAEFFNGIIPANMAKVVNENMKNPENIPESIRDRIPEDTMQALTENSNITPISNT